MSLVISNCRDEIKALLATITDLNAHDTMPGQLTPPAAVVIPRTMDFDRAMGRGLDEATFRIVLLVSRASERQGQDDLDAYLASSGDRSIKQAVESDRSLNGEAHDCVVRTWEYQEIEYAGTSYIGAEFTANVTG